MYLAEPHLAGQAVRVSVETHAHHSARGRAPFEGAEHARQTVIHWNSHTTTIFRALGMFQVSVTVGFPKRRASVLC